MGSASNVMELKLLDHILGTTGYTFIAQIYVGLSTSVPSDSGATEPATGGYGRQAINFGAASGTNPAAASNSNAPTWTAGSGGFGTIRGIALYNASSGGDMIGWALLTADRVVNDGDSITLTVGSVVVQMD